MQTPRNDYRLSSKPSKQVTLSAIVFLYELYQIPPEAASFRLVPKDKLSIYPYNKNKLSTSSNPLSIRGK